MSRTVETIISPSLFSQIEYLDQKIVVVIDVLRATSTLCTILANGASSVMTVGDIEHAKALKDEGYLVGGERGGMTVDGFNFGNSPLEYTEKLVADKDLVLTTTNGTKCIDMAKGAKELLIGSFLNLSSICDHIDDMESNVVLLCAGWKDRVNLEDSLLAGAICHELNGDYEFDDASLLCQSSYFIAEDDLFRHMQQSSHFQRLSGHGLDKDIEYCCQIDVLSVLPVLKNSRIVNY